LTHDFGEHARYLIQKKYVTGMDIETLAQKLMKLANGNTTPSQTTNTRESVYGCETAKEIQRIVDSKDERQKSLITSGERESKSLSNIIDAKI